MRRLFCLGDDTDPCRVVTGGVTPESRQQVRGDLAQLELHRLAVSVALDPARVVARGHRHVSVAQLRRDAAKLNARREELRGERVAELPLLNRYA